MPLSQDRVAGGGFKSNADVCFPQIAKQLTVVGQEMNESSQVQVESKEYSRWGSGVLQTE